MTSNRKAGLVLPGGGAKGAFQVGVIKYLTEKKLYKEGFSIVSGTSVGALNALAIAHHAPDRDQLGLALERLLNVWSNLDRGDIWSLRQPAYIAGLWKPSIGKTKKLRKLLEDHVDLTDIRASGVELRISAVDLLTGELKVFNQNDDVVPAVMASSSFPLAFPPIEIEGGYFTDGGVADVAPLKPAIDHGCTEIVVIPCQNPYKVPQKTKEQLRSVIRIGYRVAALMEHQLLKDDILTCRRINLRVRDGVSGKRDVKLHIIFPQDSLGSALDFDFGMIHRNIQRGYSAAERYFAM